MNIKPLLTEKSLNEAKKGKYSFWVPTTLTKTNIKNLIQELFKVKVSSVKTINYKKNVKKTYTGKRKTIPARKKAIISLVGKDKIDLFETKK